MNKFVALSAITLALCMVLPATAQDWNQYQAEREKRRAKEYAPDSDWQMPQTEGLSSMQVRFGSVAEAECMDITQMQALAKLLPGKDLSCVGKNSAWLQEMAKKTPLPVPDPIHPTQYKANWLIGTWDLVAYGSFWVSELDAGARKDLFGPMQAVTIKGQPNEGEADITWSDGTRTYHPDTSVTIMFGAYYGNRRGGDVPGVLFNDPWFGQYSISFVPCRKGGVMPEPYMDKATCMIIPTAKTYVNGVPFWFNLVYRKRAAVAAGKQAH